MNSENMQRYHFLSQKYDEYDKPLYLSYPIENHFEKKIDAMAKQEYQGNSALADVYVHLPFCRKMCYFCCCDRVVFQNEMDKDIYINAIEKELLLKFGQREKMFYSSMHWGGGTPTFLTEKQIERLYITLEKYFTKAKGSLTNIEAYPDDKDITREKLRLLKQLGFDSISFGIQDFDKRVQQAINREYEINNTLKIIDQARAEGFMIHIDLCYGLPFQGLNEFEKTLETVKKIKPEQIVINPYVHYPFLFPLQRKILYHSIPNSFIKLLLSTLANDMLGDMYTKYGIDTYIRKDSSLGDVWNSAKITRNLMGTSIDTQNPLYGIGMAAISRCKDGYKKNSDSLKKYEESLSNEKLPIVKEHMMTKDDELRYHLIQEQILGMQQINKKQVEDITGIPFFEKFERQKEEMAQFEKDGLITDLGKDTIFLTDMGSNFSRCIAHIFNEYYE